jgi:tetratricopeptide (TPR) repeat protein
LLPVINIIPLTTATLLADRYAYFSSMGFALALAYFICKADRRIVTPIVVVLCLLFSILDIQRNRIWKDEPSLFSQMTKDAPEKALGYHDLGRYYYDNGDIATAVKYLKIASTKDDMNSRMLGSDALVFLEANELDLASTLLLKKIKYEPANPQTYIILNRIYEKMGNTLLAKTYHDKAEALMPGIEDIMKKRAESLCRGGEQLMAGHKLREAETLFKEALGILPDFIPALINMGSLSAEKKDFTTAVTYFTKAVALDPANLTAHYNLSMTYEILGKTAEAREYMSKFRELDARSAQRQEQNRNQ